MVVNYKCRVQPVTIFPIHRHRASSINKSKTWTVSKTANYLTSYAEGLLCSYKERTRHYHVRSLGQNKFGVIHEKYDCPLQRTGINPPMYIRVRIVDVFELCPSVSYMTCTCMSVQAMLLPCVHCMVVLESLEDEVNLSNIHPRWMNIYGYDMSNHVESSNVLLKLREVMHFYESTMYCPSTGQYLGIPLSNQQYMAVKKRSIPLTSDKVTEDLFLILNYNLTHGPRVAVDTWTETPINPTETPVNPFYFGTQVQSHSQGAQNLPAICVTSASINKSMCEDGVFTIMRRFINASPTQEDMMLLEEWVEEYLVSKSKESKSDLSIIGSELTNKRKFRRHFFQGERNVT